MNGILSINKPVGMTSREAVDQVIQAIHPRGTKKRARMKVGHAGTLDPLASGVLLVCIRSATRLVPLLHEFPKTYHAQFRLGETSETHDIEGTVVTQDVAFPSQTGIEAVLPEFVGRIMQRPPRFSALQVGGRRSYELAREQQIVELAPRVVSVHRLSLLNYLPPILELEIECGSGTYIRSLARDLGQRLGTGALMSGLNRVSIGPYHVRESRSIASGSRISREQVAESLLPLHSAVSHLPVLEVSSSDAHLVRNGGRLAWTAERRSELHPPAQNLPFLDKVEASSAERIALVEVSGDLAAIAELQTYRLQPRITLPA